MSLTRALIAFFFSLSFTSVLYFYSYMGKPHPIRVESSQKPTTITVTLKISGSQSAPSVETLILDQNTPLSTALTQTHKTSLDPKTGTLVSIDQYKKSGKNTWTCTANSLPITIDLTRFLLKQHDVIECQLR